MAKYIILLAEKQNPNKKSRQAINPALNIFTLYALKKNLIPPPHRDPQM